MEGKKLALLCVLWSVFSVTECVWRNGTRRRRSETCPEGLYEAENGLQCCRCPKGHYLQSDCSSPQGRTECLNCESGTYLDHVNSERKCELCKICSGNENMEQETRCSASSNTVCRCTEGHYCSSGDQCKVCHSCSTCEEFGVKTPCNLTSDAQCNEKSQAPLIAGIVVLAVLLILISVLVIFFWRKKKFCFKAPETAERSEELEQLNDLDLEPFLSRIAEILGFKVVRNVVKRLGLSQSRVDNIMEENPHDVNEQAHQLLLAWYQKHGMKGANGTLDENLRAIGMKVKSERVQKLINDGQSKGQTEQNGEV